jgi:hypothetical protein
LRLTPMAVVEGRKYELVVHPLTAPPEDTWHVLEYSLAAEPAGVLEGLCTSRKEEEGAEVVPEQAMDSESTPSLKSNPTGSCVGASGVEVSELCKTYALRSELKVLYGAKTKSLASAKREHTTILELKKDPVTGVGRVHSRVSVVGGGATVYARSVPPESPE